MERFEIVDLSRVTFVSDRGANFLKALKDFQAYSCTAHRLNNIIKRCFFINDTKNPEEDAIGNDQVFDENSSDEDIDSLIDVHSINDVPKKGLHILQTIIECKKLVKYIKQVSFPTSVFFTNLFQ